MKESQFIEDNEADWKRLESLLVNPNKDADQLLQLFEKVSGDLAYARTFYPNRSVRLYLNNLTQKVLNSIDTRKSKFKFSDIIHFYRHDLPAIVYESKNAFLTSLFVFVVAVVIGALSTAQVPEFANVILGDRYIEMTEDNINEGDPMAVYKDENKGGMFMAITINNIRVSFLCFILGFLAGVGTIYVLISNGIMLGAFQYFFYTKGLFLTSFLTIWIHGTLEISAIIIAGAAGIILGNGLLFPKSYDRNISLLLSSKKALKIILGIVPLFIMAGFLESFVTRLTELPTIVKVLIIGMSLLFILVVFVFYPWLHSKEVALGNIKDDPEPVKHEVIRYKKYVLRSFSDTFGVALAEMRYMLGPFFSNFILPAILVIGTALYLLLKFKILASIGITENMDLQKYTADTWPLALTTCIMVTFAIIISMMIYDSKKMNITNKLIYIKKYFLVLLPFVIIYYVGFSYSTYHTGFAMIAIFPPQIIFIFSEKISNSELSYFQAISHSLKESYNQWFNYASLNILVWNVACLGIFSVYSAVVQFLSTFITWHDIFDNHIADSVFVHSLLSWIIVCLLMPFVYCIYTFRHGSLESESMSADLFQKLKKFGQGSNLFESR